MTELLCHHLDVRKVDGLRRCLARGEALFKTSTLTESSASATSRSLYKYIDLNYKLGQEIRLLTLFPGYPTDELWCDIIHVNLEDEPDCEAVSIMWASDDGDASLS
jgi:hypothetical protein